MLWDLPSFNLHSVFFDFFHTCLEGEFKKLTIALFAKDTKDLKQNLFSDAQRKLIDKILEKLPLQSDDERLINFSEKHPYMR